MDQAFSTLLGFRFARGGPEAVKEQILAMAATPYRYVITPNVDFVVRAYDSPEARHLYDQADMHICDSRVLALALRPIDSALTCLPGANIVRDLLAEQKTLRFMLIGPTPAQLATLRELYPHCTIELMPSPRSFSPGDAAWQLCLKSTAAANWDILLICFGSPKQEAFASQLRLLRKGNGVALCVGASVDFLTGDQRRAPEWVQRIAMEWAFRLLTNPKRLFRRYLINNPKFFLIMLREVWIGNAARSAHTHRNWVN